MQSLLQSAGGLVYHLRARRYRTSLWRGFAQHIEAWLANWPQTKERLVLVGPSAGYVLPQALLKRYRDIDIIEPDPLARHLLARRIRKTSTGPRQQAFIEFFAAEALPPKAFGHAQLDAQSQELARFSHAGVEELARYCQGADLLFCNVLGQLPLAHPELAWEPALGAWQQYLCRTLNEAKVHWASFHDRISFDRAALCPDSPEQHQAKGLDDTALRRLFTSQAIHGRALKLREHGCATLFEARAQYETGSQALYLRWPMTPRRVHIVEALAPSAGPIEPSG